MNLGLPVSNFANQLPNGMEKKGVLCCKILKELQSYIYGFIDFVIINSYVLLGYGKKKIAFESYVSDELNLLKEKKKKERKKKTESNRTGRIFP